MSLHIADREVTLLVDVGGVSVPVPQGLRVVPPASIRVDEAAVLRAIYNYYAATDPRA